MFRAFINRPPTPQEILRLCLAMSTFCDGSGQLHEPDGSSLPGWRDFERIVAELFSGICSENKDVFDVIVRGSENIDYGISIKSKKLDRATAIGDLSGNGRVYMELCNSPAKIWKPLHEQGFTEATFRQGEEANKIGDIVLNTVKNWHSKAGLKYEKNNPGRMLDLSKSIFLTISYSKPRYDKPRQYQLHSFNLDFPSGIQWKYPTPKCLRGYDPHHPDEIILDLYALSGGQLKYYPRATSCRYASTPFSLIIPPRLSIIEKARKYWPQEWLEVEGS